MISDSISHDIPPQIKILNMVIPILMCFYRLVYNWSVASRIKPHKGVHHQMKCDVINDVKLFPTVYRRIYCRKILTLSNQTSHYKSKCIRIIFCVTEICSRWIFDTFLSGGENMKYELEEVIFSRVCPLNVKLLGISSICQRKLKFLISCFTSHCIRKEEL